MIVRTGHEDYAPLEGELCFYCHQRLRAPSVLWIGADGDIYLHPECVVELTIRLFRDLWELECSRGYVTSRTTAELRARLRAEEGIDDGLPFA